MKKTFKQALFLKLDDLLFSRTNKEEDNNVRFKTTYNSQHGDLREIISRRWFLLTSDPTIKNVVSSNPSITFQRSRSFRDSVTSSHFDLRDNLEAQPGTFPCGSCAYCNNLDTRSSVLLPDGTTWTSRHHVDCTSRGIVYLLDCPCGAFYVGITRREFHRPIYDHVYAASIGYYKSPIGRHVALVQNYSSVHLTLIPLTHIRPNPRGGDWERMLLRAEARWIFRLKVLTPQF